MLFMGLDISTKTGVSIIDNLGNVVYEEEIYCKKEVGFPRIKFIANKIFEVYNNYLPDYVIAEETIVGMASSALTVISVSSIVKWELWNAGVIYTDVNPSKLKKFATGKGNCKKEEVMMYVLKHWGHTSKTNNTADATVLAHIGRACIYPEHYLKSQLSVLE